MKLSDELVPSGGTTILSFLNISNISNISKNTTIKKILHTL